MQKPVIGITTSYVKITDRSEGVYIHWDYHKAIERLGGIPLLLPTIHDKESMAYYASHCDGFIFSGGEDVNPRYYNQMPDENIGYFWDERDEFEFALFKEVSKLEKPILGICRGIQLINVIRGGSLQQHVPTHVGMIQRHRPYHSVQIQEESLLGQIIGTEEIEVNSLHHQTIDRLGDGLVITAVAPDGQIEAVEDENYPYLVAVQWHPESMVTHDRKMEKLFLSFLAATKKSIADATL